MAVWDLLAIQQKVRQVTGRYSPQELSNTQLTDRINKYYQYTFPAEVKLERAHTYYEFLTEANKQSYDVPTGFTNFEPLATIDRYSVLWYQSPDLFYDNNPEQINHVTMATGDGVTVAFNTTVQGFPILPDSTVITDNNEVFEDTNTDFNNSPVNITGSLGGTATVNYSTGAVSVTFNTAPSSGQNIYLSYIQFNAGRPIAVLLYNHQFTFFPVPDTAYRFRSKAYSDVLVMTEAGVLQPTFINATDRPLLDQWGPAIAYGTARDIHADLGEMDAYQEVTALYKEQLAYVLKRTNQNLLNTRAMPNF